MVGDIIGDAISPSSPPRIPSPPVGSIEVVRRRVMKDGRVKLKLSLLGISVDRCGICLSQFKDQEAANLGSTCQHACVLISHLLISYTVLHSTQVP